ncbi:MAG: hypothetical protein D3923_02705 [Candidatus Electrothrix sp. AR3]|nr:hypothetical protein [Candidatus Electrothrix sp. AR3]
MDKVDLEKGFKRVGKFTLESGVEVFGELSLKGAATSLELYADTPFELPDRSDIFGWFHDQSKMVSLTNCILKSGRGCRGRSIKESGYVSAVLFPHLVLLGDEHIRSSDRTIYKMNFAIDDAETLFYDPDTFGSIHINARSHLERIFDEVKPGEKKEFGTHPTIHYNTGKFEIISVDTVFGKISANNYTAETLSIPNKGIHIKNTIKIDIEFSHRKNVNESIKIVSDLLKFLEIIAGRPQNISWLTCLSMNAEEQSDHFFDVYRCSTLCHKMDKLDKPLPSGLPIQAATKPEEFSRVLRNWATRHDEWKGARYRFSTAFAHQNRYTLDRLVGAANMFDILPSSACPKPIPLSADLEESRCNSRKEFKKLPVSLERDSVLNALGRIGQPSLKRKVRHRAKFITDIVGDHFPDLEFVIDQSVDCRNYYVHGTTPKIDYDNHFNQVMFFTDTLEFIFAASDFIESGWDIATWLEENKKCPVLVHPFASYHAHYLQSLDALNMLS